MGSQTSSSAGASAPAVSSPEGRAKLQGFWARYFTFYDTLNMAIPYRQMIQQQAVLLEIRPNELVLDAGTGTGNVAVELIGRGARVIGLDFCVPALDICRGKAPGADFRFGDLTQPLEFDSGHFDKVACCCVLHLLERPAQAAAIKELARVLKPGGLLCVTVFAAGFKPIPVWVETLRAQRAAGTLMDTVDFAFRYFWRTLKFLYYVGRIRRQEKSGSYKFVARGDMARYLKDAGLEVRMMDMVFAGQCLTALAYKPAAEGPA